MRSRAACLLLPAIFAVCLSGCGRREQVRGNHVTLTLSCWEGPQGLEALNQRIGLFRKRHPNVQVEIQQTPGSQYYSKLLIQFAGGNPPDIMQLAYDQLPRFAAKGTLAPLDDLIRDDRFPLHAMFPELLPALRYKGITYGLPRGWTTFVMFYNKDRFRAAGVPFPRAGWTWDEFLAVCKRLQAKAGRHEFAFSTETQLDSVAPWLWSNGGDYYDTGRTHTLLDRPEAIESFEFLQDLVVKHHVAPLPSQAQDFGGPSEMFLIGKQAMTVGARVACMAFRPATFEWDIVPLPVKRKPATVLFCNCYVLRRNGPHLNEAWELMQFLCGPEGQAFQASTGRDMPSFRSVAYSPVFVDPKNPPEHDKVFLNVVPQARPLPVDVYSAEINELITTKIRLILTGQEQVRPALDEIAPKVNKLLKEKWY